MSLKKAVMAGPRGTCNAKNAPFALFFVVVSDVDGDFAVDFVHQVIALGNNGVFVPLRNIDWRHGESLAFQFRLDQFFSGDHFFATLGDNSSSSAFGIQHARVFGLGMNVDLVAGNSPCLGIGHLATILHARIILAFDAHFEG